jgi:hypothetical protein
VGTREVSSTTSYVIVRLAKSPSFSPVRLRLTYPVSRVLSSSSTIRRLPQFAEAVEVAEQRHVGVGRVMGVLLAPIGLVGFLGGAEKRQVGPQHHDLEAAPLGGEP